MHPHSGKEDAGGAAEHHEHDRRDVQEHAQHEHEQAEDERSLIISITDKGEELKEQAVLIPQKIGSCLNMEPEKVKAFYDTVEAMKEEAIHVVRNMPRWEPARQNGKRVETTYTLPVSFKLQ